MTRLLSFVLVALTTTGCVKTQRTTAWDTSALKKTSVKNATRLADGDLELDKLRRKVLDNPMDNSARLELAAHYEKTGQKDLAMEHYRIMGARHPEDELVALLQAIALKPDDPVMALTELRKFAANYPVRRADTYSMLGILEDQAGNLVAGEGLHRKALELEPKSDRLYNNLGFNLSKQGKPELAAAEFRKALALNGKSQVARNNLAAALVEQDGHEHEAFKIWKRALGPAQAHNNVGASLMQRGNAPAARKEFQQAVSLNPGLAEAWRNLQMADEAERGRLRDQVAPLTSVPETGRFEAASTVSVLQPSTSRVGEGNAVLSERIRPKKPAEISSILWTDKGVHLR